MSTTQLREIVKTIRAKKNWTQRDMAAELDIEQADIQRMETAGRNQEKQFAIFVKLLPFCLEFDLLKARDLLHHAPHEQRRNSQDNKEGKIKVNQKRQDNV